MYDISQPTEGDALIDSLNTNSSMEGLLWYQEITRSCICAVTHTADVQLWKTNDAEPYAHFRRSDLAKMNKVFLRQ